MQTRKRTKFKEPKSNRGRKSTRKSAGMIAKEYHISENTIARALYAGKFPATSTPYSWLIDTSNEDFKKWLEVTLIASEKWRDQLARARAAKAERRLASEHQA